MSMGSMDDFLVAHIDSGFTELNDDSFLVNHGFGWFINVHNGLVVVNHDSTMVFSIALYGIISKVDDIDDLLIFDLPN